MCDEGPLTVGSYAGFPYWKPILRKAIVTSYSTPHIEYYISTTSNVMSCYVMSCHVMLCHVMSCHVMYMSVFLISIHYTICSTLHVGFKKYRCRWRLHSIKYVRVKYVCICLHSSYCVERCPLSRYCVDICVDICPLSRYYIDTYVCLVGTVWTNMSSQ